MASLWSSVFPETERRVRRVVGTLAAGLLSAAPAGADPSNAPPDFHATARLAGFEQPIEIRQSGLKRRIDLATDAVVQSYIADRGKGVLFVLTAAGRRRLALVFPLGREDADIPVPLDLVALGSAARLDRIGGSRVAGRPCAIWRYTAYLGRNGMVCATAEGVVLQLTPDGRSTPLFEVQVLDLARQDPRWFSPPPDYQIAALPGLGGATRALQAPAPLNARP
jgi:hypothetical protein